MPQHIQNKQFLKDVFLCSLASYGGPEAHYGVFSRELIDKKKYISQEEMTELIGIFSLLPGPSSTQTITAIGYRVGGPWIALASFLIWILPALIIMTSLGIGLEWVAQNQAWNKLLIFLPAVAVSFILYAAIQLTRKVVTSKKDLILYISFYLLSFVLIPLSSWSILLLLLAGGLAGLVPVWGQAGQELQNIPKTSKVRWQLPATIIILAILFSAMANYFGGDSRLFASIYRYGYSIIGGGQIMIPLMIQDLVKQEGFLSQADFLAGYSLDQAVPGPLFSFASFVAARSVTGGIVVKFLAGLLGGGLIFLPGILLVYFATPPLAGLSSVTLCFLILKGHLLGGRCHHQLDSFESVAGPIIRRGVLHLYSGNPTPPIQTHPVSTTSHRRYAIRIFHQLKVLNND